MVLTTEGVITQVVIVVIMFFVNALLLMLSTKIFKLKDTKYMTALKLAVIIGVVGLILDLILAALEFSIAAFVITLIPVILVDVLLSLYLIKTFYKVDWKKSALVWLVWFVLSLVAAFIIAMVVAAILAGVLVASSI